MPEATPSERDDFVREECLRQCQGQRRPVRGGDNSVREECLRHWQCRRRPLVSIPAQWVGMALIFDRLPIALGFALIGWCLGWASAWFSDWLMAKDDLPSAGHGLLLRDPLVQGRSATAAEAAPRKLCSSAFPCAVPSPPPCPSAAVRASPPCPTARACAWAGSTRCSGVERGARG